MGKLKKIKMSRKPKLPIDEDGDVEMLDKEIDEDDDDEIIEDLPKSEIGSKDFFKKNTSNTARQILNIVNTKKAKVKCQEFEDDYPEDVTIDIFKEDFDTEDSDKEERKKKKKKKKKKDKRKKKDKKKKKKRKKAPKKRVKKKKFSSIERDGQLQLEVTGKKYLEPQERFTLNKIGEIIIVPEDVPMYSYLFPAMLSYKNCGIMKMLTKTKGKYVKVPFTQKKSVRKVFNPESDAFKRLMFLKFSTKPLVDQESDFKLNSHQNIKKFQAYYNEIMFQGKIANITVDTTDGVGQKFPFTKEEVDDYTEWYKNMVKYSDFQNDINKLMSKRVKNEDVHDEEGKKKKVKPKKKKRKREQTDVEDVDEDLEQKKKRRKKTKKKRVINVEEDEEGDVVQKTSGALILPNAETAQWASNVIVSLYNIFHN